MTFLLTMDRPMTRRSPAPARNILPFVLVTLITLLAARVAHAQTTPATEPATPVLGSNWHVWLITFGPGEEVYEQFGHDAICFYDDQTRNGVAYDWGRFDFKQPNFIGRFLKGRMLYSMGDAVLNPMLLDYSYGADRDLWRQELNLTAQQKAKLFTICETGMLPENREYRYDYYKANCATKTRDALDEALGGQIRQQLGPEQTDKTYRWHTLTQVQPFRLIAAGLDMAMAQPTDVKLSAWDESFLPHTLQEHLRSVTVVDELGRVAPLVLGEQQMYHSKTRPPNPTAPPRWLWAFLLIGLAIGGLMLLLTVRRWRRTFIIVAIAWSLAATLAALFMIILRLFTDHEAGYRNENLFLFEPLSLALLVMIPAMLMRKRVGRPAPMVALAVLSIAFLGLLVKPLPWFFQQNWWMMALALPVHAALAYSLIVWRRVLALDHDDTDDAQSATRNSQTGMKGPAMTSTSSSKGVAVALVVMLANVVATGCGGDPSKEPGKIARPPKPPPAVPARHDVPIDPALRDAARHELESAAKDQDPIFRCNAVDALRLSVGADAKPQVLAALNDPDALVRFAGCVAAGQLQLEDARPRLMELVDDPDSHSVQAGSRFALHRLGDTRYSHGLEKLARDQSPRVRGNVAMVLGLLNDKTALNVLRGMSNDLDPAVRLQVAEAMWRLSDDWALDTLVAGTVSGFADDQILCVLALAAPRDQRVLEHVRGKLTSDYTEVALAAARAMGQLGSDAGYGVAEHGAKSKDPRQRSLAAMAFGDIGRPDAQPILSQLLHDPERPVRLAAATAILELK